MPELMHEATIINIHEAEQRVSVMARWLFDKLDEFNVAYPDPDAEAVTEYFDYFTHNYVIQTCASVLAECHVILPQLIEMEAGLVSDNQELGVIESSIESQSAIASVGVAEDEDENEVEAS